MAHEPWTLWILLTCAEWIFFRYAEGIARQRPRGVNPQFLQCSKWISQMYLVHGRRSHFCLIHHAFPLFMAETRGVYKMLDFMGSAWFGTRTLAHSPLFRNSSLRQTVYFGAQECGMVVNLKRPNKPLPTISKELHDLTIFVVCFSGLRTAHPERWRSPTQWVCSTLDNADSSGYNKLSFNSYLFTLYLRILSVALTIYCTKNLGIRTKCQRHAMYV
jgi:hypothetical protein